MSEDYKNSDVGERCERLYKPNRFMTFVKNHTYTAVGLLAIPVMYVGLMAFYSPDAAEVARQEEVLLDQKQKGKKSYWQRLLRQKEKTLDPLVDTFFLGKGEKKPAEPQVPAQ